MLLSIEQVCTELGCKRSRVFQLLRDGTLERAPRFGRELRIFKDSVDRAINAGRYDSKPAKKKARAGNAPAPFKLSDVIL